MELKTSRNCHALYNLQYHLIIVTKMRKPCITEEVFQCIKAQFVRIADMNGASVEEMNYEKDHVHVLLNAPPQVNLATMVNVMKSTSSRLVRKQFAHHLEQFYWKPFFWSRSYLILSSGGAPIEVIKKYIKDQKNV